MNEIHLYVCGAHVALPLLVNQSSANPKTLMIMFAPAGAGAAWDAWGRKRVAGMLVNRQVAPEPGSQITASDAASAGLSGREANFLGLSDQVSGAAVGGGLLEAVVLGSSPLGAEPATSEDEFSAVQLAR